MNLTYACPICEQPERTDLSPQVEQLACSHCEWSRSLTSGDWIEQTPARCLACGCHDLWRQKDFPQWLGVTMVGSGAVFSTIAWYYMMPVTALGILMGFALVDLLLYALMPDVLVCYRCAASHRQTGDPEQHPKFNLEVMERYRQEAIRQNAGRA